MFKKIASSLALALLACGPGTDSGEKVVLVEEGVHETNRNIENVVESETAIPLELNIATEQKIYEIGDSVEITTKGASLKFPKVEYELTLLHKDPEFNGIKPIPQSILNKWVANSRENNKKKHFLIRYHNKIPTKEEKKQLEEGGIHISGHYQKELFFAKADSKGLEKILSDPAIEAYELLPNRKISELMYAQTLFEKELQNSKIGVEVAFSKSATPEEINAVIQKYDLNIQEKINSRKAIISVNIENAIPLAEMLSPESIVQRIAPVTPPIEEIPPVPSFQTNADARKKVKAEATHSILQFDGSGIIAYVHDGGAVYEHRDLKGRVKVIDESFISDHPTHVACTLAGDGTRTVEWAEKNGKEIRPFELRGVAPGVKRIISDQHNHCKPYCLYETPAEIDKECKIAIQKYHADLSSNSIGTNIMKNFYPVEWFGDYETTCSIVDGIVRGSQGKRIVMIFAAGNENNFFENGVYGTLGQPASAKNPIIVGAVDDADNVAYFTSWGPTDDGRTGVTVVAPGVNILSCLPVHFDDDPIYGTMSGTSMATPAVSGVVALVIQAWREITNTAEGEPLPSTIKAILSHTATDVAEKGLDFKTGFGRVNAAEAIEKVIQKQFLEGVISKTGEKHSYILNIPEGKSQIKATLVWDDVPGVPGADKELVNDLDLSLVSPSGEVYYPQVLNPWHPEEKFTTGIDRTNNIEQVIVKNPETGKWKAVIRGYIIPEGPQEYSLVYDEATESWGRSYIKNESNNETKLNVSINIEKLDSNKWTKITTISEGPIVLNPHEEIELRDISGGANYVPESRGDYIIKLTIDNGGNIISDAWKFYVR